MGKFKVIAQNRRLTLWPLVMTIFFCVSGGPYGLEPIVQSGRTVALLLILFVPLIWALPVALMSAELGSAIPEEGGYYVWVKEGIGPRSALACGWLTYLYTWVDVAIYPVLFLKYLAALGFSEALSNPIVNFVVTILMIAPLTWINIRGAAATGRAAMFFAIALLAPFAYLVGLGMRMPAAPSGSLSVVPVGSAFTSGLFVIMWNYLGWDSISTVAREIKDASRILPKALMIGVPLVVASYFLPVYAGIQAVPDTEKWIEGSWPAIAGAIGGKWLGISIAVGGLLSAAGLFSAGLLAASRVPFVLANDGYLLNTLSRLSAKYGTPVRAILLSSCIYLVLTRFTFEALAQVDVLLYSAALVFELIALVRLRRTQPNLPRPFRIPGGIGAVSLVAAAPGALIVLAAFMMLRAEPTEVLILLAFASLSLALILRFRRPVV